MRVTVSFRIGYSLKKIHVLKKPLHHFLILHENHIKGKPYLVKQVSNPFGI
jgi:hypothetical protein